MCAEGLFALLLLLGMTRRKGLRYIRVLSYSYLRCFIYDTFNMNPSQKSVDRERDKALYAPIKEEREKGRKRMCLVNFNG